MRALSLLLILWGVALLGDAGVLGASSGRRVQRDPSSRLERMARRFGAMTYQEVASGESPEESPEEAGTLLEAAGQGVGVYQGVMGRPGVDFPVLPRIPRTSFSCRSVRASGYYADLETDCQVFHICDAGRKISFLCPNGTMFRQSQLVCDWWWTVDCAGYQHASPDTEHQLLAESGSFLTSRVNSYVLTPKPETTPTPSAGRPGYSVTTPTPTPSAGRPGYSVTTPTPTPYAGRPGYSITTPSPSVDDRGNYAGRRGAVASPAGRPGNYVVTRATVYRGTPSPLLTSTEVTSSLAPRYRKLRPVYVQIINRGTPRSVTSSTLSSQQSRGSPGHDADNGYQQTDISGRGQEAVVTEGGYQQAAQGKSPLPDNGYQQTDISGRGQEAVVTEGGYQQAAQGKSPLPGNGYQQTDISGRPKEAVVTEGGYQQAAQGKSPLPDNGYQQTDISGRGQEAVVTEGGYQQAAQGKSPLPGNGYQQTDISGRGQEAVVTEGGYQQAAQGKSPLPGNGYQQTDISGRPQEAVVTEGGYQQAAQGKSPLPDNGYQQTDISGRGQEAVVTEGGYQQAAQGKSPLPGNGYQQTDISGRGQEAVVTEGGYQQAAQGKSPLPGNGYQQTDISGRGQEAVVTEGGYQQAAQGKSPLPGNGYQQTDISGRAQEAVVTEGGYQQSTQGKSALPDNGYQQTDISGRAQEAVVTEGGYQQSTQGKSALPDNRYQHYDDASDETTSSPLLKDRSTLSYDDHYDYWDESTNIHIHPPTGRPFTDEDIADISSLTVTEAGIKGNVAQALSSTTSPRPLSNHITDNIDKTTTVNPRFLSTVFDDVGLLKTTTVVNDNHNWQTTDQHFVTESSELDDEVDRKSTISTSSAVDDVKNAKKYTSVGVKSTKSPDIASSLYKNHHHHHRIHPNRKSLRRIVSTSSTTPSLIQKSLLQRLKTSPLPIPIRSVMTTKSTTKTMKSTTTTLPVYIRPTTRRPVSKLLLPSNDTDSTKSRQESTSTNHKKPPTSHISVTIIDDDEHEDRKVIDTLPSSGPATLHSLAEYFRLQDILSTTDVVDKTTAKIVDDFSLTTTEPSSNNDFLPPSPLLTKHTVDSYASLFSSTSTRPMTSSLTSDDIDSIDVINRLNVLKSPESSIPAREGRRYTAVHIENSTKYDDILVDESEGLRELAQVFSRALSAYLDNPEEFRRVLAEVRPTPPQSKAVSSTSKQFVDHVTGNPLKSSSTTSKQFVDHVTGNYLKSSSSTKHDIEIVDETRNPAATFSPIINHVTGKPLKSSSSTRQFVDDDDEVLDFSDVTKSSSTILHDNYFKRYNLTTDSPKTTSISNDFRSKDDNNNNNQNLNRIRIDNIARLPTESLDNSQSRYYPDNRKSGFVYNNDVSTAPKSGFDLNRDLSTTPKSGFDLNRDFSTTPKSGFDFNNDFSTTRKSGFDFNDDFSTTPKSGFDLNRDFSTTPKSGFDFNNDFSTTPTPGFDFNDDFSTTPKSGFDLNRDFSTASKSGFDLNLDFSTTSKSGFDLNRDFSTTPTSGSIPKSDPITNPATGLDFSVTPKSEIYVDDVDDFTKTTTTTIPMSGFDVGHDDFNVDPTLGYDSDRTTQKSTSISDLYSMTAGGVMDRTRPRYGGFRNNSKIVDPNRLISSVIKPTTYSPPRKYKIVSPGLSRKLVPPVYDLSTKSQNSSNQDDRLGLILNTFIPEELNNLAVVNDNISTVLSDIDLHPSSPDFSSISPENRLENGEIAVTSFDETLVKANTRINDDNVIADNNNHHHRHRFSSTTTTTLPYTTTTENREFLQVANTARFDSNRNRKNRWPLSKKIDEKTSTDDYHSTLGATKPTIFDSTTISSIANRDATTTFSTLNDDNDDDDNNNNRQQTTTKSYEQQRFYTTIFPDDIKTNRSSTMSRQIATKHTLSSLERFRSSTGVFTNRNAVQIDGGFSRMAISSANRSTNRFTTISPEESTMTESTTSDDFYIDHTEISPLRVDHEKSTTLDSTFFDENTETTTDNIAKYNFDVNLSTTIETISTTDKLKSIDNSAGDSLFHEMFSIVDGTSKIEDRLNESSKSIFMDMMQEAKVNSTVRRLVLLLVNQTLEEYTSPKEVKSLLIESILKNPDDIEIKTINIDGEPAKEIDAAIDMNIATPPLPSTILTRDRFDVTTVPADAVDDTTSTLGLIEKITSRSKTSLDEIPVDFSSRAHSRSTSSIADIRLNQEVDNRAIDLLRSLYSLAARWG